MNLAPFEFALRKNYYRHNGPFNWIAIGFDMSIYWLLGPQEKKAALLSVYTGHFDTISNLCENTTAIEKLYKRPTNHHHFFQLIMCAELIRLKKNGADLSAHSVGDYATPIENKELIQLIELFRFLKSEIHISCDQWIQDCTNFWGSGVVESWLERQIDFLTRKQKSIEDKPLPQSKTSPVVKTIDGKKDAPKAVPKDVEQFQANNLESVTLAEAEENIDSLIGLGSVKKKINDMVAFGVYDKTRGASLSKEALSAFNNFIISGPPGVGKTTLALCIAKLMAASDVIPKKQVIFTSGSRLIGQWCGTTEKNIEGLFEQGRGGVIIIDEADSWAKAPDVIGKHDLVAINTLNALTGYEKDTGSGTIIILTGYKKGMESLMNTNPGMLRRFPHRISIPGYDSDILKQVFISMASARGYEFDRFVAEVAGEQIARAKDYLGDQFGNAGTVEELIQVMEAGRANWIGRDILQEIYRNKSFDPATRQVLSRLNCYDVPIFDPRSKTFKTMAAIKESHGNLIRSKAVN